MLDAERCRSDRVPVGFVPFCSVRRAAGPVRLLRSAPQHSSRDRSQYIPATLRLTLFVGRQRFLNCPNAVVIVGAGR